MSSRHMNENAVGYIWEYIIFVEVESVFFPFFQKKNNCCISIVYLQYSFTVLTIFSITGKNMNFAIQEW